MTSTLNVKQYQHDYYLKNKEKFKKKRIKWYELNKEKISQNYKKWYLLNRERKKGWVNKRSRKWRQKVLDKFGNKCKKCGFNDSRVLQVDHINGGGVKEHKAITNRVEFCRMVLENKAGKYQLLCANCNWIKRWEKNENRRLLDI